jgi:hypothetical protein
MRARRAAPIQEAVEIAEFEFAFNLYFARLAGTTWQQLAEANNVHRSTARRYAMRYEEADRRNALYRNTNQAVTR